MADTSTMSDGERLAYMGIDAQRWSQEWCRIALEITAKGGSLIDEGWMIGWFANAIETGRSAGLAHNIDTLAQIRAIVGQACGTVSMCWAPPPSVQVFESEKAAKVVDDAVERIAWVLG